MKWFENNFKTSSAIAVTTLITFGYVLYRVRQSRKLYYNEYKRNLSFASQHLVYLPPVMFKSPIGSCNTLIFVHPPKTGGTNLCYVVEALSKKSECFKATRFTVPRVQGQSPGKIYENWIGGLQSAKTKLDADPDCCKDINFISGHFPFGLHAILGIKAKYVVLVRNPIEREISNTNFDFQRGYFDRDQAKEYLLTTNIDNPQTRMLAGAEFMHDKCTQEVLDIAKSNIEKYFLLAGVTEDTNSFIQILASIQNWGPLALTRNQVTGDKVFTQVDPEFQKLLAAKHSFDMQLYEWVKRRWFAWKNAHIDSVAMSMPVQTSEKVLCVLPEFATTRKPVFMGLSEIEQYNRNKSNDLMQVTQDHFGLKQESTTKLSL